MGLRNAWVQMKMNEELLANIYPGEPVQITSRMGKKHNLNGLIKAPKGIALLIGWSRTE